MMKDPLRDIDRVISQALASEAERFAPADLAGAEQRFLRSRRRRRFTWFGGAALATAAAVVAVAVFPRPDLANENRVDVAAPRMTTISVGQEPLGISATREAVWVANSGDGTVSRIDPDTNEVVATIELGGAPEEVAANERTAWVYEAHSRNVMGIDSASNAVPDGYNPGLPDGTHLDLALKGGTLWMADPATRTVYSVDEDKTGLKPGRGGDVSVGTASGEVWSYDGDSGSLTLLEGANGIEEPAEQPDVTDVLTSEDGDLAVGGDALWVSDDFGVIMRIDRQTYEKEYVDVGGRYSDLSFGGGYLWALTANEADDGTATLRQIDPVTVQVGEEFPLEGGPVDVAADDDAVWVAHKDNGAVTRIDVTRIGLEGDLDP